MSLGLGHRYWVHMIQHFYGTLDEVLEYMNKNKPRSEYQWYELRADVNVKEKKATMYSVDLVEMSE